MTTTSTRPAPDAPQPPPAPHRRVGRFVAAALLTVVVALGTIPDLLFGLDRVSPFAQIVSFRPLILVAVGLATLLALVATVFQRRVWPFAVGLLAVAVAAGVLVVPRTIPAAEPTAGRPLTVLSFNVFEGHADPAALAAAIRTVKPDVVALPEAGFRYSNRIGPLVAPLGYRVQASTPRGRPDVQGVTVLVAPGLGDVSITIGTSTPDPYLQVTGGALGNLRFVAYHASAPVTGKIAEWRSDLAGLSQWCAGPTPAVVAGDLNATLDHSPLRAGMTGCSDAAAQRGDGLAPTWGPTDRTRAIGPQIDHVLSTGGIEAQSFSVLDLPGSDHHAILTRLLLPA